MELQGGPGAYPSYSVIKFHLKHLLCTGNNKYTVHNKQDKKESHGSRTVVQRCFRFRTLVLYKFWNIDLRTNHGFFFLKQALMLYTTATV